jgi:hypothetical protein
LQVAELLEGALGGALVGVEAALEVFQALFEVGVEGGGEGVTAAADVVRVVGIGRVGVEPLEFEGPEVGFDALQTADLPFVADDGVDEIALAGG